MSKPRYSFLGTLPDHPRNTELVKLATKADADAIDRILEAVRKIPPGLDRKALCADISDAYYLRGHTLYGGSTAQKERDHLRRIRKTTEKLLKLLKADDAINAGIVGRLKKLTPDWEKVAPPMGLPVAQRPIDYLSRMVSATADVECAADYMTKEWRTAHKRDPVFRGRRPTENEYLAGVSLPLVFEWHFRERAGRSRSEDSKPSGPMVRFINATMQELGLPFSDESIVRAFSLRAPLRQEARKGDVVPFFLRQTG